MNELVSKVINLPEEQNSSFWTQDLAGYLEKLEEFPLVVEITSLFIDKQQRNQGIATQILKDFCDKHEDYLIFTRAAALCKEYPEQPTQQEIYDIVDRLIPFYEKRGFINVNDHIGDYENSCMMLYNNQLAKNTLLPLIRNIK